MDIEKRATPAAENIPEEVPESFKDNPEGYRIWLGFQQIMKLTQEEKEQLFGDDFAGGGCH